MALESVTFGTLITILIQFYYFRLYYFQENRYIGQLPRRDEGRFPVKRLLNLTYDWANCLIFVEL